ncbi:unnamed protein product [Eruca vesicaria subsp. sativa]|uniref:F-box domain-containing protein n=1 Tax=Eruca vesicaria subsp. sativa TaxID=29727 RepID=A0ABC8KYU9_ERUVS|nr:unnamed protein product [Eruca vesicaria subsp. sativa]
MASSSLTPVMKEDGECRNWADLPSELISLILRRLDSTDILENAQKVCTTWRRVCKDPAIWRKIFMRDPLVDIISLFKGYDLKAMCCHAVDRSEGGLVEIDILYFGTDSLLNYIADRSSNLRSLRLAMCSSITTDGLTEAVVKLPLLEELEVSYCSFSAESLKVVGQSLPHLKTLKLDRRPGGPPWFANVSDIDALAIAETMPGLRFLQLLGNLLSDVGLNAILDSCPHLEHLDLRQCFKLNFDGDLEKKCSDRIKVFRRPRDSADDFPFYATIFDHDGYYVVNDPYER